MSPFETVLFILLWIVIVTEGVLLFILYRHVGRQMIKGRSKGLELGIQAPKVSATSLYGDSLSWHNILASNRNLLIFASPQCEICHRLLHDPRMIQIPKNKSINLYFLFNTLQSQLLSNFDLDSNRLNIAFVADQVFQDYQVVGTPFAYFLDDQGRILAHEAIRSFEHLESLCNNVWQINNTHNHIQTVDIAVSE